MVCRLAGGHFCPLLGRGEAGRTRAMPPVWGPEGGPCASPVPEEHQGPDAALQIPQASVRSHQTWRLPHLRVSVLAQCTLPGGGTVHPGLSAQRPLSSRQAPPHTWAAPEPMAAVDQAPPLRLEQTLLTPHPSLLGSSLPPSGAAGTRSPRLGLLQRHAHGHMYMSTRRDTRTRAHAETDPLSPTQRPGRPPAMPAPCPRPAEPP